MDRKNSASEVLAQATRLGRSGLPPAASFAWNGLSVLVTVVGAAAAAEAVVGAAVAAAAGAVVAAGALVAGAVVAAVRYGLIPHRRRPGAGCYGEIRIRADDFPRLGEHVVLWRARRRPA